VPMLYRRGEVLSVDDTPEGTEVVARVGEAELPQLQDFVQRPVSRRVRR